uniref:Secondary thiamine-phosphate synthase enzyme n=1 Tax=Chlamydomonas leiostraca TaxID=1034604 RepID=A0A7S0RDX2_9CHLO|mmetsp:Transcript_20171/g.51118  ORF Transcript_20171/g.51118 Transcript_20171/m.51118 type:complete len:212 (+) Transcript_20171:46-681(+)
MQASCMHLSRPRLSINRTKTSPVQAHAVPGLSGSVLSSPGTVFHYKTLHVDTAKGVNLVDITPSIREEIAAIGLQEGFVNVLSRHTTTAVTINENEARLMDDVRQWLRRLAPPSDPYLHNDLHLREAPQGWPGGHAAWVKQEPENAHSHLLSMMLGNTLTVPVSGGKLALGTWQSVLLVELDGPRPRTVGVQLVGHAATPGAVGAAPSTKK